MFNAHLENTLRYDASLCIGCGLCSQVCPHGVFNKNGRVAFLVRRESCMECGACQRNCPTGAVQVDSGVGCASGMIRAALSRRNRVPRVAQAEPCCQAADR